MQDFFDVDSKALDACAQLEIKDRYNVTIDVEAHY